LRIYYKNIDLEIFTEGNIIDFDLNSDIDSLREKFNELIGDLSLKNNSIEYWTSRISERNTLVHDLFLDICKIELIKKIILTKTDVVVYTNNISLFLFFKKEARLSLLSSVLFIITKFLVSCKPYLTLVKYVVEKTIFNLRYKNKAYIKDLSNHVIIQTWVSDGNFKENNFKDTYYGNLASLLKQEKKKVITWPVFFHVHNVNNTISFLRRNHHDFLIMEDYLTTIDYLVSIKHFFQKRYLKLGQIVINKNDYSSIFDFYKKKECIEEASLMYRFAKKLKENKTDNTTFLINHENMIYEKGFIFGVRTYLKKSKVVGYFHSTKPKNILCLDFASIDESTIAPKPDLIIFNSYVYNNYFKNKYSKIPTKNGIAFKQQYLNSLPYQKNKINQSNILVIFSGVENEVKLMFSIISKISNKHFFLFRMHPMFKFHVNDFYSQKNYKLVNSEIIPNLLLISGKVLSTYSALALEISIQGFNLGLVYDKKKLLINPFDDTGIKNYNLISNIKELTLFLEERSIEENRTSFFNTDEKFKEAFLELI